MEIENISGVRVRLTPSVAENWLWNGNIETFCKSVMTKLSKVSNWSEVTTDEKDELIAEYESEHPMPSNSVRSSNA